MAFEAPTSSARHWFSPVFDLGHFKPFRNPSALTDQFIRMEQTVQSVSAEVKGKRSKNFLFLRQDSFCFVAFLLNAGKIWACVQKG